MKGSPRYIFYDSMFTFNQVKFYNPVISSFVTDDRVSNESISTGSTSGAGTTYRSRARGFTRVFLVGLVLLNLQFYVQCLVIVCLLQS